MICLHVVAIYNVLQLMTVFNCAEVVCGCFVRTNALAIGNMKETPITKTSVFTSSLEDSFFLTVVSTTDAPVQES